MYDFFTVYGVCVCASKPTGDESSGFRVWGVCASKSTGDAQGGESGEEMQTEPMSEVLSGARGQRGTGDG